MTLDDMDFFRNLPAEVKQKAEAVLAEAQAKHGDASSAAFALSAIATEMGRRSPIGPNLDHNLAQLQAERDMLKAAGLYPATTQNEDSGGPFAYYAGGKFLGVFCVDEAEFNRIVAAGEVAKKIRGAP